MSASIHHHTLAIVGGVAVLAVLFTLFIVGGTRLPRPSADVPPPFELVGTISSAGQRDIVLARITPPSGTEPASATATTVTVAPSTLYRTLSWRDPALISAERAARAKEASTTPSSAPISFFDESSVPRAAITVGAKVRVLAAKQADGSYVAETIFRLPDDFPIDPFTTPDWHSEPS